MPILKFNTDLAMKAIFGELDASPFKRKFPRGVVAQLDEMIIEEHKIRFRWRGQDVAYVEVDRPPGGSITITGISMETEVTLE